tara:strand:- start:50 stop:523 length:474 start_codon:yes stop_codon:yes gene_type:complete
MEVHQILTMQRNFVSFIKMNKLLIIIFLGLFISFSALANNQVTFKNCYSEDKYSSFEELVNSGTNVFDEWSFLINFEKNLITRTVIYNDKHIAEMKNIGQDTKKVSVESFKILSQTSKFVVVQTGSSIDTEYTFNLQNGELQTYNSITGTGYYKCST